MDESNLFRPFVEGRVERRYFLLPFGRRPGGLTSTKCGESSTKSLEKSNSYITMSGWGGERELNLLPWFECFQIEYVLGNNAIPHSPYPAFHKGLEQRWLSIWFTELGLCPRYGAASELRLACPPDLSVEKTFQRVALSSSSFTGFWELGMSGCCRASWSEQGGRYWNCGVSSSIQITRMASLGPLAINVQLLQNRFNRNMCIGFLKLPFLSCVFSTFKELFGLLKILNIFFR